MARVGFGCCPRPCVVSLGGPLELILGVLEPVWLPLDPLSYPWTSNTEHFAGWHLEIMHHMWCLVVVKCLGTDLARPEDSLSLSLSLFLSLSLYIYI